jgi:hypothetical protein
MRLRVKYEMPMLPGQPRVISKTGAPAYPTERVQILLASWASALSLCSGISAMAA